MKGAFEYACKIWEELLPNTLPITFTQKLERYVVLVMVNFYQGYNQHPITLTI